MGWGTVELEPEVRKWLEELPSDLFARAAFYVELLADEGPLLGEPYTRQLDRKLRELRFHLDGLSVRITYWIASGRRIVLLTVFVKSRMRERMQVERARFALERCIAERHSAEESENDGRA
ncbi:type II toxin-antitoxin system RelE/ParE family toxin [Nocardia cyriacigeorgica]|uniref:type II toxin-antitoxin system RelE/ParE family toxin n=1 Tax=Nocardia cyriacigeorgica TaxID=135487 RepID=UPI0018961EAB|nr:type II toxin-antitoxin system RelE/ParE family toxin [Nocardia cyriacigeorgica]MBF6413540.1 type II toxin-antitoxin system RelE/ParE family toxin [Nocardia cyriacigeorgica]